MTLQLTLSKEVTLSGPLLQNHHVGIITLRLIDQQCGFVPLRTIAQPPTGVSITPTWGYSINGTHGEADFRWVPPKEGTFYVIVDIFCSDSVRIERCNFHPTTAKIVVSPPNRPPLANAGFDQISRTTKTVNLDGTSSYDPDGDSLTFAWSQTSGNSVNLLRADSPMPSFVAPITSTELNLGFKLTVSDGRGGSSLIM